MPNSIRELLRKQVIQNKAPLRPPSDTVLKRRTNRMKIQEAATVRRIINITYRKTTTREVKNYDIEPYSYRYRRLKVGLRKMLYGYDVKDKTIKGFSVREIRKTVITNKKYRARWKVELELPQSAKRRLVREYSDK
jgi:hypothetical protein